MFDAGGIRIGYMLGLASMLVNAAKEQTKLSDNAMIINEPAKPVAGSSKHPDNMDIIDGELIY